MQERGIWRTNIPKIYLSSYVGSIGQTLTTNVSMTLCKWQICHQTYVLCGCTTFGTELKIGTKLIRSVRLL